MKAKNIIAKIMAERNITQGDLTTMMNMKSQSAISGALNRDMKITTLNRFLSALNCELIVRDRKSGQEFSLSEDE